MLIIIKQAVLAVVMTLLPFGAAQATVFFDNGFESETVNTASGVPVAGYDAGRTAVVTGGYTLTGGMTLPNKVNSSTAAGGRGATVYGAAQTATTGFSSQCVGLFSHPDQFKNGCDAGLVKIEATPGVNEPFNGTTTGKYVFSFEMSVTRTDLDTSGWAEKPGIALHTNYWDTTHTIVGYKPVLVVSDSLGNITVSSSSGAPGGTAITTNIVTGLSASTAYNIAVTMDMDARTFTVAVNGAPVGGTFYQLVAAAPGLGLGEYIAVGGKPAGTSVVEGTFHFYDNIKLQSYVPEPEPLSSLDRRAMLMLRPRT